MTAPKEVAIDLVVPDQSKAIATVGRALDGVGGSARSVQRSLLAQRSPGALPGVLPMSAGFMVAQVALQVICQTIDVVGGWVIGFNSRLEQAQIGFTTLLGSGSKARAFIDEMKAFAAVTPFEFAGLQDAAQRMLAMGFSSDEVLPKLTAVGDAVAALGGSSETLNQVTYALGQMKTAGRINAQDMMQLTSAAIPAWDILSKAIGKSVAETRKLSEQGLIPADQAIEAITRGMEDRFGGMMAKQSQTFQGGMSTVSDSLQMVSASGFKPFFDQISSGVVDLGNFLSTKEVLTWAASFGASLRPAAIKLGAVVREIYGTGGKIGAAVVSAYTVLNRAYFAFVGGIGAAFAKNVALADIVKIAGQLIAIAKSLVLAFGPAIVKIVGALAGLYAVITKNVIPVVLDLAQRVLNGGLAKFIAKVGDLVIWVIGRLTDLVTWITSNRPLMELLGTIADGIGVAFGGLADMIGAIPGVATQVFDAIGQVGRGIVNTFVDAVNTIIDAWNALPFDDIPKLARLVEETAKAKGAIVMVPSIMSPGKLKDDLFQATTGVKKLTKETKDLTDGTKKVKEATDAFHFSLGSGGDLAGAKKKLADLTAELKDKLKTAFSTVKDAARKFFDDLHTRNLKAIEDARALANAQLDAQLQAVDAEVQAFRDALDAKRDAQQEAQLRAGLAKAQAGDETGAVDAEAVRTAQEALDNFLDDQALKRLEKTADAKRSEIEAQREQQDKAFKEQVAAENARYKEQVTAFNKELAALQAHLLRQKDAWSTHQGDVLAMLKKYGVDYKVAGSNLGAQFASGLQSQVAAVNAAASALAAAARFGLNWMGGLQDTLGSFRLPLEPIAASLGRGPAPAASDRSLSAAAIGQAGSSVVQLQVIMAGGIVDPSGTIGQQIADSIIPPLRRALRQHGYGVG